MRTEFILKKNVAQIYFQVLVRIWYLSHGKQRSYYYTACYNNHVSFQFPIWILFFQISWLDFYLNWDTVNVMPTWLKFLLNPWPMTNFFQQKYVYSCLKNIVCSVRGTAALNRWSSCSEVIQFHYAKSQPQNVCIYKLYDRHKLLTRRIIIFRAWFTFEYHTKAKSFKAFHQKLLFYHITVMQKNKWIKTYRFPFIIFCSSVKRIQY